MVFQEVPPKDDLNRAGHRVVCEQHHFKDAKASAAKYF